MYLYYNTPKKKKKILKDSIDEKKKLIKLNIKLLYFIINIHHNIKPKYRIINSWNMTTKNNFKNCLKTKQKYTKSF